MTTVKFRSSSHEGVLETTAKDWILYDLLDGWTEDGETYPVYKDDCHLIGVSEIE